MKEITKNLAMLVVTGLLITGMLSQVALSIASQDEQEPAKDAQTVTATGTAAVRADPDRAYVVLGVETQSGTAAAAQNATDSIATAIRTALENIGIAGTDIRTEGMSMRPAYMPGSTGYQVIGYIASQTMKVTVTDISKLDNVIDTAMNNGANRLDYVGFFPSDTRQAELKRQALENAVRDARAQAEAVATELGMKIGKVVKVTEITYTPAKTVQTRIAGSSMIPGTGTPVHIEPRTIEASVTVSVEFTLE